MRRWINEARNATRRVSADEGGFTLVEVMASITILVVAVLAIAGVAAQSMRSTRLARDRQLATQAATAAVEGVRAVSYDNLAMEATCADAVAEDDYVVGSCPGTPTLDGEELILSADPDAVDYKVVEGRFTVRTFVTWYDDATTAGNRDAKRITVSVTWNEVGGPDDRELTQSTIVSDADRGLPVPEFIVRPTSQSDDVETGAGNAICLTQILTNIGAEDTYDFLATKGGTPDPRDNHIKMGNWVVYGWLGESDHVPTTPLAAWQDADSDGQIDVDSSGNPIPNDKYAGATNDAWYTLMHDRTGDLIPDSNPSLRVPRNASRTFVTCYYQKSNAELDPTFTVTVRSGFDSSVTVDLTHAIDTTETIFNLYLRDPESVPNESGKCTDHDWNQTDPFVLVDDSAPFCDPLRDFDANQHLGPGLLLPKPTDSTTVVARFDYQFQEVVVTIGGSGTFRLWTSHPAAASGTATSSEAIVFDVVLNRLNTDDSTRNTEFHRIQVPYTHTADTVWQGHTIDLSSIVDTDFASQEFLRLEISCDSTSTADCLIAYDTANTATVPADANLIVFPS